MLAEVVRYRPFDDYVGVVIQVEEIMLYARIKQARDRSGKTTGYLLWVSDSPTQYPSEQSAIEAACRYAERIVLGVNHQPADALPGATGT